jgi:hypothetical protein
MKNVHLIPTDEPSRLGRFVDTDNLFLRTPNDLPRGENVHVYITNNEEIRDGVNQWYLDKVLNKPYNSGGAQYSSKQDVIILTTDEFLIADGIQEIPNDFLEWFVNNPSCQYGGYKDIAWDQIITLKEEPKQYPIGGYAPGFYSCECITCKTEFMGDKLAIQCEPCAIKTTQEEPKKDYSGLHLRHCYQGEYKDGCKYGKDDCPAKPLEPKQETIEEAAEHHWKMQGLMALDESTKPYIIQDFTAGAKWQQEQDKNKFSEEEVIQILINYQHYLTTNDDRTADEWFENIKEK